MDKAKAMELANKILNANKKDASFFDFINPLIGLELSKAENTDLYPSVNSI